MRQYKHDDPIALILKLDQRCSLLYVVLQPLDAVASCCWRTMHARSILGSSEMSSQADVGEMMIRRIQRAKDPSTASIRVWQRLQFDERESWLGWYGSWHMDVKYANATLPNVAHHDSAIPCFGWEYVYVT